MRQGRLRVATDLRGQVASLVAAAGPAVELVDVGADGACPDLGGCVVFLTAPWVGPHLEEVVSAGVRWVHVLGTGVDTFPFDRLADGVVLTCSRGASAVPIAEYVLAAMLVFEKRVPDLWIDKRPARWAFADLGVLEGRTLGLVGLGGIGTAVARRALAFDMEVVAIRRRPIPSPLPRVRLVGGLGELLPVADHLVLAAPATPATRHILDASALASVKPGVHLVNVARGALVDQDALLAALDAGRVARATLDVADPEPLPAGHPLYRHPRVRLSPHVSWAGPGSLERLVERFLDNLERHAAGQQLVGVVDRGERY